MSSQRKHERYPLDHKVEMIFEDGENHPGYLKDFSLGGAFVYVEPQPEFGSKIVLRIDLPGVPNVCEIPCFVRWNNVGEGAGAGIQFEYLRPIEVWALSKLIRKLKEGPSEQ